MLKSFKVIETENGSMLVVARNGDTWRLYGDALNVGEVIKAQWINSYACDWTAVGYSADMVDVPAPANVLAKIWRDN